MLSVKQATIEDLKAVIPLFEAYRKFYGKASDTEGSTNFIKKRMEHKESVLFIAEKEGAVVGFVQLYPLFSSTRLQRLWLLNDLFVSVEYRKLGVATALLQKAQQLSRDTKAAGLLLETEKSNLPGNKLYPKMGFSVDEEHHYYFWETTPLSS